MFACRCAKLGYHRRMQQQDDSQASDDAVTQGGSSVQQDWNALQEELQKLRDLAGRAQADLQNAKARAEREAVDIRTFATETMLHRLLPTLDNFQRAFQHVPDDLQGHEWVKGVEAIEQEFLRTLSDAGLRRMESMGEMVDPYRHDVLTIGPGKEGVVTEVFEEGYTLHEKVIRPAKVRAGDGAVAAEDEGQGS